MKQMLKTWLILILAICGCDSSRLFEENLDLPYRVWLSQDKKVIDFYISDTTRNYNLYFNVRNTMDYPHYNLYLSYSLEDSVNNVLSNGLQNFELFDPKSGEPRGQSGLGDIFDHQFLLIENFRFENPGRKNLELQQFMRYDSLPEIISTGMRIEYSGVQ